MSNFQKVLVLVFAFFLIFGGSLVSLESKSDPKERIKATYDALADFVENDQSRPVEKRSINSIYDLQIYQQRANRFAVPDGAISKEQRESMALYFADLDGVEWTQGYAPTWIIYARQLSREL